MNVADKIVKILEEEGIENVFGIPGDQIMPVYKALSESSINHVLTRHEQAAAHAADGYYRSSGKVGVCIGTASPGALNFTMAVATAFKDNIPRLVLTGDNDLKYRGTDQFQSTPQVEIFKNITKASYNPLNGTEAMYVLRAAIYELKTMPKGPIHINLSKDVLLQEDFDDFELCYLCEDDMSNISKAQELIDSSQRPLMILGAGAISQKDNIQMLAEMYQIPITTTFHGKGIIFSNLCTDTPEFKQNEIAQYCDIPAESDPAPQYISLCFQLKCIRGQRTKKENAHHSKQNRHSL